MTTLQNANQPQSTPTAMKGRAKNEEEEGEEEEMIGNTIRAKQIADQIFDSSSSFPTLGLHPILCEELQKRMGIQVPTLVQAEAIPVILSGRHVLVNAATGTGKTITYVAPIIHLLKSCDPPIQRSDGTFALVLVPTRELCMQVYEILRKLLYRFHGIIPGYIMGGENRSKEKARLRKGISILVATPGRLLDHLKNTSSFTHNNLRCIIFDEADRILELGFGKEIEDILEILGSRKNELISENNAVSRFPELQRQNLLLSATLNDKVNHLAKISLENPVMIGLSDNKIQPFPPKNRELMKIATDTKSEVLGEMVCSSTGEYKLPAQLIQRYVKVSCGSRLVVLLSILKNLFNNKASQKIAVFFSTCDAVDFHYSLLSKFQWPPIPQPEAEHKQMFLKCKTFRLHGNMKQEDRRSTFMNFKTEQLALLLCTDVAARGLDFPKVRCIIQYDSPGEATEYVHRVGRTARMGERGDSLLFLQPVELDYLKDLEKHGVSVTEYPILKELDSFALHDQKHQFKKVISLELHPWVLSLQKALETFVLAEPKMKELAKEAFCSWTRAYTAHRGDLKRIFTVKKLHLGHVAKSFALKEQPALVGQSFRMQQKKRKRDEKHKGISRRKKTSLK